MVNRIKSSNRKKKKNFKFFFEFSYIISTAKRMLCIVCQSNVYKKPFFRSFQFQERKSRRNPPEVNGNLFSIERRKIAAMIRPISKFAVLFLSSMRRIIERGKLFKSSRVLIYIGVVEEELKRKWKKKFLFFLFWDTRTSNKPIARSWYFPFFYAYISFHILFFLFFGMRISRKNDKSLYSVAFIA